jgi:glycosyltransferase involved in cell wall biosynthesis
MISVVMPTYNSAAGLARSIKSILDQTFTAFELLVIDDGSTDGTEAIVASFHDSRIRYLRLPHQGISASLNAGLSEAKFSIIARMDAGDLAAPDRLQKQFLFIEKSSSSTVVSCHYVVFRNDSVQYLVKGSPDPSQIRRRLILHPDFPHPGTMFRKQSILEVGGYREVPLEDYDLWLRIKDIADFHIIQEPLMFVEHHPASLTNNNVRQRYRDHYGIQSPYYQDLERSFGITDIHEQDVWNGWREYFYGDPARSRSFFLRSRKLTVRISIAFILTYLPETLFVRFKELRMRQRLNYLFKYFRSDAVAARDTLDHLLRRTDLS